MDTQQDDMTVEMNPFTMTLEEDAQDEQGNERPVTSSQHQDYFLHSINSTISIRQLPSQGLSFQLWPAANTLVNLLDQHSSQPTNIGSPFFALLDGLDQQRRPLRILELGSGTGVAGIAAAAILGAHVTVTDLPHVLPNLQFNIDFNSRALKSRGGVADVAALGWGKSQDMEAIGRDYDLILASDVVYHDHLYEPLLQTLRYLMLGGGEKEMVFLMSHLKRWKKEATFFKKASKLFDIDVIHKDVPPNGSRIGVVVYRFVRKCTSNMSIKSL